MKICFLDCETTSLDFETGEIWEVGCIVRDYNENGTIKTQITLSGEPLYDIEHHWFLPISNLDKADPFALDIGKFWERYPVESLTAQTFNMYEWSRSFMMMTKGAHIVGAVPDFDVYRLDKLLKRYGCRMFNHYHLVCVENLVAGRYGMEPPWKSDDMFSVVGLNTEEEVYQKGKHTALGDTRVVRDVYDLVMAKPNSGN